ncbi:NAD(P)-dependent oxidoreductase [Rhizobium sp. 0TCS1.26]|uniref:NAD-dependent epimerase/dehydratase family protein n=1 Tax=Rhizobium sp. 0TCS1.26 TaxID=3142623 RepID=UPI003D26AA2C
MTCTLVTGSSGFIGSAICEALAARGVAVVGFDRAPPFFASAARAQGMRFVAGELHDAAALAQLFAEYPVTHIVHAAAVTPDEAMERTAPEIVIDVNVSGGCRLMAAAKNVQLRRIVSLSSISAYGGATVNGEGRFDDALSPPLPETLYGISKRAAEQAMHRLAHLQGLDLRVIRLGPVFGPWEHASDSRAVLSPHHQITAMARSGMHCILPRAVPADWIYARDAARRIVDVLFAEQIDADLFNLGGGRITTLVDWCRALTLHIPGFQWRVDSATANVRYSYLTDRPALDNRRIDAISPSVTVSLAEAAENYLAWLDRFSPANSGRKTS